MPILRGPTMTSIGVWRLVVLLGCCRVVVASGAPCYPAGGVAGIVVATIIVTLVVTFLVAAVLWRYWWTPRQNKNEGQGGRRAEPHQQQQQKSPSDFAFDNPYFRNSQDADEQDGTAAGRSKPFMNNKNSLRSSKLSEASAKAKKARGGKNHFGFGGGKKKAQDDSCIAALEPERAFVSLRGHDFTGLGFNICGNMRDGILVKDVLHRGPASESGLIKAGDKIVNVTVSFTSIVYEDALTILSYASPYDVQLEIERIPSSSSSAASSATSPKRLASCSFNNSGQKLFHPLYRSQSIDDLTQIDGGGSGAGAAAAGGGTFPSGPRRSQSVGVAAHFRRREQGDGGKEEGGAPLALTGSLNEKMLANVMTDGRGMLQWEKRFEDTLDNDPESSPRNESSSSKKPSAKAHLDYPPNNLKLETRHESPPPRNSEGRKSARKTAAEVVSTRTKIEVPPPRRTREDENDSDVSRDSLEVSHRAFVKRNAKGSAKGPVPKADEVRVSAGRSTDPPKVPNDRAYIKSSRVHSNSLSSNEETVQDSYSRFDSVDQNIAQPTPKPLNVFSSSYGERQPEESYSSKITVNGGHSDDKVGRQGPSPRAPEEAQTKFSKKAAPAGGMFTQINPFQVSSSKQRARGGPWATGAPNGEQPDFQGRRENIGYSGPKLSLKESSIKHRQF